MITPLNEEQRQCFESIEVSPDAVELYQGNTDDYFVYDRKYGFFSVPFGLHVFVMAFLHGFHKGRNDRDWTKDVMDEADEYIETREGTIFASGLGRVMCGKPEHLNRAEKLKFRNLNILYLVDKNREW